MFLFLSTFSNSLGVELRDNYFPEFFSKNAIILVEQKLGQIDLFVKIADAIQLDVTFFEILEVVAELNE